MLIKFLIFVILSTVYIENASAELEIIAVNLIDAHPDYVDKQKSFMKIHPNLGTILVKLHFLKPLPLDAVFDVEMIEDPPGDILIPLVRHTMPICNFELKDERKKLPRFIKQIATPKQCGMEGVFETVDAGLYEYSLPRSVRSVPYPIINANEIISDEKVILKYDVILMNWDAKQLDLGNPHNLKGNVMTQPKTPKKLKQSTAEDAKEK